MYGDSKPQNTQPHILHLWAVSPYRDTSAHTATARRRRLPRIWKDRHMAQITQTGGHNLGKGYPHGLTCGHMKGHVDMCRHRDSYR